MATAQREPTAVSTVRVYDASGLLVATVDPITRERTAVERRRAAKLPRMAATPAPPPPEPPPKPLPEEAKAPTAPPAPARDADAVVAEIEELQALHEIKKVVHEILGDPDETADCFRAGVVLAASFFVGQATRRLAEFTGVGEADVVAFRARWVADGIWKGGKGNPSGRRRVAPDALHAALAADEAAEAAAGCQGRSGVTFMLCCLVALGLARYDREADMWRHNPEAPAS